ncbi:hypothetical protein E2605_16625 [Dysgonomonas capnocytophagoides]|uniref:DUF481 domain-containing protein n=1 Tax=Dysgonomonas capnocytophagoides TaxID=45254 RepID=A0A4Y8L1T8_9BACT|nr:hypothetical protein [Dysgonomonas capnocytophagoides]TFD93773.1 hypothetical protein E2605_16625 [Dysgonomonas capnocytophagoides]
MNKSISLLLLLMMSSLIMYSQSEIKRDSLANRLTPLKEIPKEPIIYQEPLIGSMDTELDRNESYDNVKSELPNYLDYKLKLTPDLRPRKLSSILSYSLNEYNYNYGMGNYRQGGIELIYKPLDKLTLSLGGYNVNYNILHSKYNDIVLNFNATYEFTDWMYLSIFGQYSANSLNNARFGGYMFAPQSSYGAVLRFKTSEKVDLNVGVERVFNSLTKNWETQGIFGPTIRLK